MKIELNKQLDKEIFLDFNNFSVAGVDFGAKIRKDHPKITLDNYEEYIDSFYKENDSSLREVLEDTQRCFDEIKDVLLKELSKYFKKDYSNENYVCYLSIFDCNPRFLETKSFQVYYKRSRELRKGVIAHEITHFVFFDFIDNNLKTETSTLDKNDGTLWELSEIFNVIFLNLSPLQKILGREELLFYPNLKEKLEKSKTMWSSSKNTNEFIKKYLDCEKRASE